MILVGSDPTSEEEAKNSENFSVDIYNNSYVINSWEFGQTRVYEDYGNIVHETLPPGVYEITIHGASGSDAPTSDHRGLGGSGGYTTGTIYLDSSSSLEMYIGESGSVPDGGWGRSNGGSGGYDSSAYGETRGGGGGGSTEILLDENFLVAADGGGGGGSSDYDGWIMWNAAGGGGGGRGGSGGTTDNDGGGSNAQGSGNGGNGGDASATSGGQGRYADDGEPGGQSSSHQFNEISSSTGGSDYNNGRVEITKITRTLDISIEGQGITNPSSGPNYFADGEEVDIEAIFEEEWTFYKWQGDVSTIDDPNDKETTVLMDDSYAITAIFEEAEETQFEINPKSSTIVAGDSEDYTAMVYDQYGYEMYEVTSETKWTINDSAGGSWNQDNGFYYSQWSGVWTISAEYNGMTDNASLTVEVGEVDYIEISPSSKVILEAGQDKEFTAIAYDSEGNLITDDDNLFSWDANGGSISDDGLFEEMVAGTYHVSATYEGEKSPTVTVSVEPSTLDYIIISPSDDFTLSAGESRDFSASAYDRYGNLIEDNDSEFIWDTDGGSISDDGLFTGSKAGNFDIYATYETKTSSIINVTVNPGDVYEVDITPESDFELEVGESVEFKAGAYDKYGNLITDNATHFRWKNITRQNVTEGFAEFYGRDLDSYNVTATYGDVTSDTITVSVVEETDFPWLIILIIIATIVVIALGLMISKNNNGDQDSSKNAKKQPKKKKLRRSTQKSKAEKPRSRRRLLELREMKEEGLITEEDFNKKKEEILDKF